MIACEQSFKFALMLMGRQAIATIFFSLLLAWAGILIKRSKKGPKVVDGDGPNPT
ncbi:hypothetical protein [Dapis sp. BLCC M172]|uniref:hypothetical protein n=1 Tax=Dapis sp. BLCC M172 TaxID=2975281 RepID=UPI003CEDA7AB